MKRFRQGYQRRLWQPRLVSPRPDFLVQRSPTPRVVWGLVVTALVVLAFGAADLWALRKQADAERERLARWQQQLKPAARVAVRASVPTSAPLQITAPASARRIAEALAYPWGHLLAATEAAATPDVRWLAFEHDSERPELRLEGQSPDTHAALKTADALATRPGWSAVVLTRLAPRPGAPAAASLNPADAAPAGVPLKFELTARIDTSPSALREAKP